MVSLNSLSFSLKIWYNNNVMDKIIITATAESIEQVQDLLKIGVDRIYVGDKAFGLHLPKTFSDKDLKKIAQLVHEAGKD